MMMHGKTLFFYTRDTPIHPSNNWALATNPFQTNWIQTAIAKTCLSHLKNGERAKKLKKKAWDDRWVGPTASLHDTTIWCLTARIHPINRHRHHALLSTFEKTMHASPIPVPRLESSYVYVFLLFIH